MTTRRRPSKRGEASAERIVVDVSNMSDEEVEQAAEAIWDWYIAQLKAAGIASDDDAPVD